MPGSFASGIHFGGLAGHVENTNEVLPPSGQLHNPQTSIDMIVFLSGHAAQMSRRAFFCSCVAITFMFESRNYKGW